jgi:formylglycine-generating enzyme required for sulfatase activity
LVLSLGVLVARRTIFVNYRRGDASSVAGRIRDRLAAGFGRKSVFMDVDDLRPGERFDQRLDEALKDCRVFLAVIGREWLGLLRERERGGNHDFVRQEIATALARKDILTIPVTVDGASLPRADDLPQDLRDLVLLHRKEVTHEYFGRDLAELSAILRKEIPKTAWRRPLAFAVMALFLLIAAYGLATRPWMGKPISRIDAATVTPGQSFRDCADCPEVVVVPAGSITIGSPDQEPNREAAEGPQHAVHIARKIAVGKFEVQVKEYDAFISASGGIADGGGCYVWTAYGHRFEKERSYKSPSFSQTPSHPVVCVSWQAATTYTNWLTTRTGQRYRLPSEAEWEYAARAGSPTRYFFGENEADLCLYGNGADRTSAFLWGNHLCADGVGVQTSEVGKYRPNKFGLYDTIGNAFEWVQDCWNSTYSGAPNDGSAWLSGDCNNRVIRGGAWDNGPKDLRSAFRSTFGLNPKDTIGFRVVRDLE